MVQSVELLLDDGADAAVRAVWERLADAGLPSQERHRSPSNRPHVTLAALPAIDRAVEPALADAGAALPLGVHLGAPMLFGTGPFVLVLLVVPTAALLTLHADVAAAVGTPSGTNLSPGAWTPHVTLARRLAADDVATALGLCRPGPGSADLVALRRWDGEARRDWTVAAAP